jgi:hypothetical protein
VHKPLVMFGDTRSRENIQLLSMRNWGRMFATQSPTPFPFERWGFDNGAYPQVTSPWSLTEISGCSGSEGTNTGLTPQGETGLAALLGDLEAKF